MQVRKHSEQKINVSNVDEIKAFVCPISGEIFKDPVIAADGYTYEREHIEKWFKTSHKSPMTNLSLPNKKLVTNWSVKQAIPEVQSALINKEAALIDARVELEKEKKSRFYNRMCWFNSANHQEEQDEYRDGVSPRSCRSCW